MVLSTGQRSVPWAPDSAYINYRQGPCHNPTGLFATLAVNEAGADGLSYGDAALLGKQLVAVAVAWTFAAVSTRVILKLLDVTVGLRVGEHEEVVGLDATQHGEVAYQPQAAANARPRWLRAPSR